MKYIKLNSLFKRSTKSFTRLPIFFIVIGIILRSWRFWILSFTGDEAAHMRKAVSVSRGLADLLTMSNPSVALQNIFLTIFQHNHPPLEFLLVLPSVPFEFREFYARSIYVIINILFLPFVYYLISKLRNKKIALYSLILFSTSMYLVWSSHLITHDSLVIIEGTLVGLAIIFFQKKPSGKSLFLLTSTLLLGFYTSIDFVLFLPVALFLVYKKRMNLDFTEVSKVGLFFIFVLSIFYLPYMLYAFLPNSPRIAGFNYYLKGKLNEIPTIFSIQLNFISALKSYYRDFFSKSGVFPVWVFAFLSIFISKKLKFINYLIATVLFFLFFNLIKYTTANFYMDFYGIIILLAAEWLVSKREIGKLFLVLTVIINLYGSLPLLRGDYSKSPLAILPSDDQLKEVGKIAKTCLTENETYLSTVDPWRTFYYFGRPVLPAIEGDKALWSPAQAARRYLQGDLRNEIFLIHFREGDFDQELVDGLKTIAKKEFIFKKDRLLLFKSCP